MLQGDRLRYSQFGMTEENITLNSAFLAWKTRLIFFLLLLKVKNGNNKSSIPPGRILDLRAAAVNSMDPSSGVEITFTAPGDDLDDGKGI